MRCRWPVSRVLAVAIAGGLAGGCRGVMDAPPPPVLLAAHAHNDYEHPRPLLDALDRGFMSVEADVHLVDGQLLVAHDREEVVPGRTLERLYLQPLYERWRRFGGRIHPGQPADRPFMLLVDIKSAARPTYEAVHAALEPYAAMLSVVEDGRRGAGAVEVVISGGRPVAFMRSQSRRLAFVDGRLPDLDGGAPVDLIPLISASWWDAFFWWGDGPMPEGQRRRLADIVARAHAAGRRVRFWATPEREELWAELLAAGVDHLNTDRLTQLGAFLRAGGHPPDPGAGAAASSEAAAP